MSIKDQIKTDFLCFRHGLLLKSNPEIETILSIFFFISITAPNHLYLIVKQQIVQKPVRIKRTKLLMDSLYYRNLKTSKTTALLVYLFYFSHVPVFIFS